MKSIIKGMASIVLTSSFVLTPILTVQANTTTNSAAIAALEQAVRSAEEGVRQKQAQVDSVSKTVTSAKTALDKAEATLRQAQGGVSVKNTITLSAEYVALLREYGQTASTATFAKLKAINDSVKAQNTYRPNPSEAGEKLDAANLSLGHRQELTLFAVDLINQIRSQMGTPQVQANQSAIQFAQDVANGYEASRHPLLEKHDKVAIYNAAMKNGLSANTSQNWYEDNGKRPLFSPETQYKTMSELKGDIYEVITGFMFDGYEYVHALSIAGTGIFVPISEYMGVDFSSYHDGQYQVLAIHFLGVPNSSKYISNPSLFNRHANLSSTQTNNSSSLASLQAVFDQAKTAYDQQVALLNEATTALTQAQTILSEAQIALAQAKGEPVSSQLDVYRLYHPGLKVHLYTTDANERNVLSSRGWTYEGIAWKTEKTQGFPVYRLYHPDLRVHLYTKDANEYSVLGSRGWRQEGIAYRSYGSVPIYRLYHSGIQRHLYTKDANEYHNLGSKGWRQEGIAWNSQ